jgi:hypothetical protein
MLTRTARLAAMVVIAAAGLILTSPSRAAAAENLACGESGLHNCCVVGFCPSGLYCCAFQDDTLLFCGCLQVD